MFRREKRVLSRRYLEQGVPKAEITRRVGVSRRTVYPLNRDRPARPRTRCRARAVRTSATGAVER